MPDGTAAAIGYALEILCVENIVICRHDLEGAARLATVTSAPADRAPPTGVAGLARVGPRRPRLAPAGLGPRRVRARVVEGRRSGRPPAVPRRRAGAARLGQGDWYRGLRSRDALLVHEGEPDAVTRPATGACGNPR